MSQGQAEISQKGVNFVNFVNLVNFVNGNMERAPRFGEGAVLCTILAIHRYILRRDRAYTEHHTVVLFLFLEASSKKFEKDAVCYDDSISSTHGRMDTGIGGTF